MPGDPRSGSKVWEAPDWEIGKPGENRSQVVAHWQSDPAAGFHDRENATFGPASDCRCAGATVQRPGPRASPGVRVGGSFAVKMKKPATAHARVVLNKGRGQVL
jgi:hypothetical protein